jgi:hypothetical protein
MFIAQGNYDAAVDRLTKRGKPKQAINSYFLSAAYAGKGDKKKALSMLQKTLEFGYRDFSAIQNGPYFGSLRSDPKFQKLIQKYQH